MSQKKKQYSVDALEFMTRQKLNAICANRGISVSDETPDEDVRRIILAQQAQEATAEEPVKEPKTQPAPAGMSAPDEDKPGHSEKSKAPPKKSERVWFKVMAGSQSHEKQDVFASLNGESVLIKRNHWVKLPRKFLSVFDCAIQTQMERMGDEKEDRFIERQVPRFNVQIRTIEQGIPPEKSRPE